MTGEREQEALDLLAAIHDNQKMQLERQAEAMALQTEQLEIV